MAKTLTKRQDHELEVDLDNFEEYMIAPPAGSWRRMRLLDYLFRGEARAARDALAKELYSRVFAWVVALTNEATSTDSWEASCGLLDIFGFESFPINRFEQLCINYANERLQEKFCRDLFRSVQQEYEAENVPWAPIDFPDAQAALKLIEGSMGVVDVLDEECARPGAISASRRVEAPSRHRRDSFLF